MDASNNLSMWTNASGFVEDTYCSFMLDVFHQYYIPFIIVIGLLGNSLSCIVFLTTHLKIRSSSYYLAALAIADLGYLSMLLLVNLKYHNKPFWCQTVIYISSVCALLSVWLIVAFTVERFIAVQYPLQRPHMCTVSRAKAIVLSIVVIALITQSYSIEMAGIVKSYDGEDMCEVREGYHEIIRIINYVDTVLTLIVPFFLIVIMNTMIGRNLFLFRRRFQHTSASDCHSRSSARSDVNLHHIQCNDSSRRPTSQNSNNSTSTRLATSRRSKSSDYASGCIHYGRNFMSTRNQQNITKMLLLISSVFILLNLPSYVARIYALFAYLIMKKNMSFQMWCLQQYFMLLYYTNFSINFLLYAMCGITFRRCLWKLIQKITKAITKFCTTVKNMNSD